MRTEAPGLQSAACCALRRLRVTTPVSSPSTASHALPGAVSSIFTALSTRFRLLASGSILPTFVNLGARSLIGGGGRPALFRRIRPRFTKNSQMSMMHSVTAPLTSSPEPAMNWPSLIAPRLTQPCFIAGKRFVTHLPENFSSKALKTSPSASYMSPSPPAFGSPAGKSAHGHLLPLASAAASPPTAASRCTLGCGLAQPTRSNSLAAYMPTHAP
mmetsp:Transcript_48620/g.147894  ORF Transcript_48620/g.147894 Transcript_48620/m.147894 type:complete len:215 (-) Transcript_48620:491-1135(-)